MRKENALAEHLGVDESKIVGRSNRYFEVNPHTHLIGTSPNEAKRLVKQLFTALDLVRIHVVFDVAPSVGPWTLSTVRRIGYSALYRELQTHAPEMLKLGIQEVSNTLYFLCSEADGYESAAEHRETLREAAAGLPIQDRRCSQPINDGEYLVLTDEEADDAWDEALDSYLDDCVLPGLPEHARHYFDRPAWKRDARFDGRGHSLALYDGEEHAVYDEEDDTTCYIYRMN